MFLRILLHVCSLLLLSFPDSGSKSCKQSAMVKLSIYHYKMPCLGEGIRLCLWVSKNGAPPEYFYDTIKGFRYEWGYNYDIIAEEKRITHPAADGSAVSYQLKKLIKKEKAPAGSSFELPVTIGDYPLISSSNKKCVYAGVIDITTGRFSCANLKLAKTGIFRHQKNGKGLVLTGYK